MARHIIETEEKLIIETPERVPLEFALASIGNRFLAVTIDHIIQYFSIFMIAWFFLSLAGYSSGDLADAPILLFTEMPKWTIAILIIILFLIFAGYFIVFEWLWNGQTPGKRMLRLRVIRDDGRPVSLWEAIARNLLRICDATPGFIIPVYSIGLIVIFLNGRDQRVGDIFAGTVVIRERQGEAPTFAETFSSRMTDVAFTRVQVPTGVEANVNLMTEREFLKTKVGPYRASTAMDGMAYSPADHVQTETGLSGRELYLRRLSRGHPASVSCEAAFLELVIAPR